MSKKTPPKINKLDARQRRAASIFNPHGSGGNTPTTKKCKTNPIPSRHHPELRETNPICCPNTPNMRNEPNLTPLAAQKCKTNPILAHQVSNHHQFQRNEPNSTRPTTQKRETNPIRRFPATWPPKPPRIIRKRTQKETQAAGLPPLYLTPTEVGDTPTTKNAKRTQFPSGPHPNYAKQTQSNKPKHPNSLPNRHLDQFW